MLHHICNKHQWSGNSKVHECGHAPLSRAERKATKRLKAGSPAFLALQKIVTNTRVLNALKHLTEVCHTGEMESFHSMLLKYCSTRQHFSYDGRCKPFTSLLGPKYSTHTRRYLTTVFFTKYLLLILYSLLLTVLVNCTRGCL